VMSIMRCPEVGSSATSYPGLHYRWDRRGPTGLVLHAEGDEREAFV
jgi:hypothetical protein